MAILPSTYYPEVKAGRSFFGSTATTGVALPISTGTAVTFAVWNTDPSKVMIPLWFSATLLGTPTAASSIGFANQNVGLTGGATGNPLAAYTAGTSANSFRGAGSSSTMTFIPATATLTAGNGAGVPVYYIGYGWAAATATVGVQPTSHDFLGRVIVYPGQIFYACANAASTGPYAMTLAWDEVPISSM